MKMRFAGFLAFTLLSISILSYGVNTSAFADNHDIPPVFVEITDDSTVDSIRSVTISGSLKNYDADSVLASSITFQIFSPDNSRIQIGQFKPNSDGSFTKAIVVGGDKWKSDGDYLVKFFYGGNQGETTINYVGDDPPPPPPVVVPPTPPPPPPPPPPVVVPPTPPPPPPPVKEDPPEPEKPVCGPGTVEKDGVCVVVPPKDDGDEKTGGCLIATAVYGTELAPQVQLLREIRDNTVMSTGSGVSFMVGFNTLYYSFAPTVADWERENPMFKEAVKTFITPMLSTLSIMSLAENGSEIEVLGLGISVIALNLGMYIAAPALIAFKTHKHFKSRR